MIEYARIKKILYGGDYNPEQWPEEVWEEDMRMLKQAHIDILTLNVFNWAMLQPEEEIYDFSTIAPTMSQKLGKEGKENGYKYYDCPIAGGVAGAEAATLSIMVGCDESEFDHVKEVVAPMGKNIMYAGVTGSGSAVKMFNNYLGGSGLVACCEVMVMAKKLGIDVENVFNIINKSTGRNFASETGIIPFLKERDFSPKFATDLFYKDINIAMETAAELKMSVPIGAATLEAFGAARAMGCGKEHSIAVVKYYEALAGVKVN